MISKHSFVAYTRVIKWVVLRSDTQYKVKVAIQSSSVEVVRTFIICTQRLHTLMCPVNGVEVGWTKATSDQAKRWDEFMNSPSTELSCFSTWRLPSYCPLYYHNQWLETMSDRYQNILQWCWSIHCLSSIIVFSLWTHYLSNQFICA